MSDYITEEDKKAAAAAFNKQGTDGLREHLQSKLDEWKTISLNVGVIGNSGCGKSSFINAVRGLTADDKGAAAVGVKETTKEPTAYPHPDNHMVKFWDLPGVGTPNFLRDKYLEAIGFQKYDFFLILSSSQFTQDDAWIGQEIAKKTKKFYFVRTKIGNEVEKDTRAHPKIHEAEKLIKGIRENIQSNLKEMGVDAPIFLIDNHQPLKYDFGQLGPKLVEDLPQLKKEVIIHTTFAFSTDMVKKKITHLRSHVKFVAGASAAAAVIPVPGASIAFDVGTILVTTRHYVTTMGLNDDSLKRLASMSGVSFTILRESANEHFNVNIQTGAKAMAEFLKTIPMYAAESAAEEFLGFIPFIGSITAAALSYGTTHHTLNHMLDKLEKASLAVIEKALAGKSW